MTENWEKSMLEKYRFSIRYLVDLLVIMKNIKSNIDFIKNIKWQTKIFQAKFFSLKKETDYRKKRLKEKAWNTLLNIVLFIQVVSLMFVLWKIAFIDVII